MMHSLLSAPFHHQWTGPLYDACSMQWVPINFDVSNSFTILLLFLLIIIILTKVQENHYSLHVIKYYEGSR